MKRTFDITVAALGLLVLAPVLGVTALLVRWRLGSPVLFRQERPGLGGRLFTLLKFRTMRDELDVAGNSLADAERLTRFGRWLRSTSIDELPELWNVLRGDMSLVGPRPLLPRYLDRYTPEQARRHDVRPGITGLSQVSGRNDLDWEERLAMDVRYVDTHTFILDLRILRRTVLKVLQREGVSAAGSATMHEFMGTAGAERHGER
ncbi:MAG: sugar transferase [Opitutaceae bacterium]